MSALRRDLAIAIALAALMTLVWSVRDWADLAALRLPDTDDAMRLQQIRDWLGGQAFADVSQHRLADGLAMHWSRLPDLVPAALIAALAPFAGARAAELAAVILWPAGLFAAVLLLVGRIARAVHAPAVTAMLVAALAYPLTTLFLPGRIDHHGLQIVLLLGVVLALVGPATIRRGAAAGAATAASLLVGLETAPLLAVAAAVLAREWLRGEDRRIAGFAAGYAVLLGLGALLLRPAAFAYPGCDGFTATALRAELVVAAAVAALAAGRPLDGRGRAALLAAVGIAVAAVVAWTAPRCLDPYGGVDPWLAQAWLARVGEAQSVGSAPAGVAFGYAGLLVAGIAATLWQRRRNPTAWGVLLACQLGSLALACVQLRGAYAGAALAAPALAAVIAAARVRGPGWLAAAWLGSAGILYPLAADALPAPSGGRAGGGDCPSREAVAALARLPAGRVLAPLDLGAFGIAGTAHAFVAAPYHRNNAGNLAAYRFFLGDDPAAQRIATRWRVDYVAACGDGFGGLRAGPRSLAAHLARGEVPGWLRPVRNVSGWRLFAVERRLSATPPRP